MDCVKALNGLQNEASPLLNQVAGEVAEQSATQITAVCLDYLFPEFTYMKLRGWGLLSI